MEALSNADRFVVLLRQKLSERAKSRSRATTTASVTNRPIGREATRIVAGRVVTAGGKDQQLRRVIVEQLLMERLGAALVNEAKFQAIVDQVAEMIADDPNAGAMLAEVVGQTGKA